MSYRCRRDVQWIRRGCSNASPSAVISATSSGVKGGKSSNFQPSGMSVGTLPGVTGAAGAQYRTQACAAACS